MTTHVLATAGHVDHGKSSLILALSGTDPDRWKEEKERGLTIDLGFANISLPSGKDISLIDVPGHIRFIKNMLAGVGAIDGALFVVAATEGWKPQSEEHLRILDLLGTKSGIVVVTKADLVDDEWLELCELEISEHLTNSFLSSAPIVAVDSYTGRGLDKLLCELESMLESIEPSPDMGRPRLWIDRVFSAKGSGTIVTGTLAGGSVTVDQEMAIFHASGSTWITQIGNGSGNFIPDICDITSRVRIRNLQSHGRTLTRADPGRRLALNLTNIAPDKISRGDVLLDSSQWCATATLDASIKVLSGISHKLSKRGAYAIYIGSGDFPVKISLIGKPELDPGEEGHVRIHLNSLVPLTQGDRFILRELGRQETVAGGFVVNLDPRTPLTHGITASSVDEIINEQGVTTSSLIYKMTGKKIPANLGDHHVISNIRRIEIETSLRSLVESSGDLGFDISKLDETSRLVLSTLEDIKVEQTRVYSANKQALSGSLSSHPYLNELEEHLFSPPPPENIQKDALRELVRNNFVIECDGIYFAQKAISVAKERIWSLCTLKPEGFTVSELREKLTTSRKYILPLLGYLDANGITKRNGDFRIPGPVLVREFSKD